MTGTPPLPPLSSFCVMVVVYMKVYAPTTNTGAYTFYEDKKKIWEQQ